MTGKHILPEVPSLAPKAAYDWSRDDLIDALKTLAEEHPDTFITRNFVRKNSEIPEVAYSTHFGTFQEYVKQSGLRLTRYQARTSNQAARHASIDNLRAFSEERKSYGNRYDRDRGRGQYRTLMACSDLHDEEIDPFFERVWVDTVKQVQPDVICFNGDIFDIPEFGKYGVDPREWDVVGRIQRGRETIRRTREVAPDAQIDFVEGNHEARLLKHLVEASPAMRALLSDLHGFTVAKLFKLDEFEVNYHARCDLATFTDTQLRKEVEQQNYKVYWDSLVAHHHPEGRKLGLPGFHGHHHKHLVWSEYNLVHGAYEWHQLGAGHKRTASYCDGRKWNEGFLITNTNLAHKRTAFDYVYVGDTHAVAGGTWFYRTEEEIYPALRKELFAK